MKDKINKKRVDHSSKKSQDTKEKVQSFSRDLSSFQPLSEGPAYDDFNIQISSKQGARKESQIFISNFTPSLSCNPVFGLAGILSYEKRICSAVWINNNKKTTYWSTNDPKNDDWQYGSDSKYLSELRKYISEYSRIKHSSPVIFEVRLKFIKYVYTIIARGQVSQNIPSVEGVRNFLKSINFDNNKYFYLLDNISKLRISDRSGENSSPAIIKDKSEEEAWIEISKLSVEMNSFLSNPYKFFPGIEKDSSFVFGENFSSSKTYRSILKIAIEINRMIEVCDLIGRKERDDLESKIIDCFLNKNGYCLKSTNGNCRNKNLHAEMKMLEQISLDFCDGRFKSKLIFEILDNSISNGEFAISKLCCLNCSLVFKSLAILNNKEWNYFDQKLGTHCEATNMWSSSSFLVNKMNNSILQDVENLDFLEARAKLEEIYSIFSKEKGSWVETSFQVKESNHLIAFQDNIFQSQSADELQTIRA